MPKKSSSKYTRPQLRERIKERIKKSDRGGRPGQWSARKSQLLVQEYEKQGGGYTSDKRDKKAKSLEQWTEEDWQTSDGDTRARHGGSTERYLPKEAWDKLSDEEKKATNRKKRRASKSGKQYVSNTNAAKKARSHATSHANEKTKAELYKEAQSLEISGRSQMNKQQLARAIQKAKS